MFTLTNVRMGWLVHAHSVGRFLFKFRTRFFGGAEGLRWSGSGSSETKGEVISNNDDYDVVTSFLKMLTAF